MENAPHYNARPSAQTAAETSFLPDFCGSRMVFVIVLLAELLAFGLTLAQPPGHGDLLAYLGLSSLYIQWQACSSLGTLCVLRPHLAAQSETRATAWCYAATLGMTALGAEIAWWLTRTWLPLYGLVGMPAQFDFLLRSLAISAICWALALRYFHVRHQWRRRIESEAEARLQALQARIRPHFFFNCLNTIAGLTRRDPKLAERAVEDLAALFRASLARVDHINTLAEELELCAGYLRIEQLRLGGRLRIERSGLERLPQRVLPALTLQPLVENAVYHGIEPMVDGGTLRIAGSEDGGAVVIAIDNPRRPAATNPPQRGLRLAQQNVVERLRTFFGRDGLLRIDETPDSYRVTLTIPQRDENPDRR